MSISVRESPHISSGLSRVNWWRVGANDRITSDTYGSALATFLLYYNQGGSLCLPLPCNSYIEHFSAGIKNLISDWRQTNTVLSCHVVSSSLFHSILFITSCVQLGYLWIRASCIHDIPDIISDILLQNVLILVENNSSEGTCSFVLHRTVLVIEFLLSLWNFNKSQFQVNAIVIVSF